MNEKIENSVPLSHQRIVVPAEQHIQLYIRGGDTHGARALCEIVGPCVISCVPVERGTSNKKATPKGGLKSTFGHMLGSENQVEGTPKYFKSV